MSEWRHVTLDDLIEQVDERKGVQDVSLVLSVTEKRGVIPQGDVFKKRIATDDTSKYKVLQPLDIAYNPYLLWTGAIGQWQGQYPGVTSPVYETFRTRPDHDPRFVGLILTGGSLTPYFDATAIGSIPRRRRTPVPVFLVAQTSVPPVEEQRRIVAVMAAVDALIEALSIEGSTIANVANSAIQEAVMDIESSPLGSVLLDIQAGRSPQALAAPPAPGERGVLKVSAVKTRRFVPGEAKKLTESTEMSPQWEVRGGDLLITRANTPLLVGQVCRVPQDARRGLYLSDKTLRLVPDTSKVDPDYLEAVLALPAVRKWLGGSATGTSASMLNISQAKIRQTPVPLIQLDRQCEIAQEIGSLSRQADSLAGELRALRVVRADLLTALLSQEITVDEAVDKFVKVA
jgi:type I restriction enzyme, S subunit